MKKNTSTTNVCQVCKQEKNITELVSSSLVPDSVVSVIKEDHPDWTGDGYICSTDLNKYRIRNIREILEKEKGELNELEKEVAKSIAEQKLLPGYDDDKYKSKLTFGENLSDKIAMFGGSWRFIIIFGSFIFVWILFNTITLLRSSQVDPYPYILLNLMLSCLAAIQAPIIMMSQNRQESKDRSRSEYDYKVNLKAELEIQHLNEKIAYLINVQWINLLELQQMQVDMLDEIKKALDEEKEI